MQYRTLYDYALNTGEFYQKHCLMTRKGASRHAWALHVLTLLRAYRREFHEPYEGMSGAEIALCATELQQYYIGHLEESERNI